MKINYVPGLALRFYPGLSREATNAIDTYVASNCKIAIFTGTAPTEQQVWDLANFNAYVTANNANLVYQETTQLQFSYDGYKHKRVIQRYPVDSTNITTLCAPVAQDLVANPNAIETAHSLYALVYCPDKDTTLNTTGNDLIILVPNVGSGATDFCSLSKYDFAAGENIYLRNLTISLFQGYQITDTLINGEYEDPLNPGQMITGPVDSKKSVYINNVWGNRLSEAYRDCFVSRDKNFLIKFSSTNNPNALLTVPNVGWDGYFSDYEFFYSGTGYMPILRKYDVSTSSWSTSTLHSEIDKTPYYGYLVNQSMIDLIDAINSKAILGQLGSMSNLILQINAVFTAGTTHRFKMVSSGDGSSVGVDATDTAFNYRDLIPGLLAKNALACHSSTNYLSSIKQLLIEQGFDSGMVTSALRSVIPISFDNTKYNSSFNNTSGVLTIQNQTPAKLKTRYKKSIHNPGNEQLYIYIPRFLSRGNIESVSIISNGSNQFYHSVSSVSYPATQKVIDGEVVDNTTQRIRQQDYTAISIGVTGNGETDLEYDLLDVIDYIDSFTAMVKIPNKF